MVPPIPQTPHAAAAVALATEACPTFLLNHSYRTYLFGRLILGDIDVDEEAAFVAAIIHDLGLTEAHTADAGFEQVGADVAARFLEARGWEPARIGLVEQAIVRHTNLTPNEDPEDLVVQAGAALDAIGIPPAVLNHERTRPLVDAIVARYPRTGFLEGMRALYFAEISKQPNGVFARLESTMQFSDLMGTNPLDHS